MPEWSRHVDGVEASHLALFWLFVYVFGFVVTYTILAFKRGENK